MDGVNVAQAVVFTFQPLLADSLRVTYREEFHLDHNSTVIFRFNAAHERDVAASCFSALRNPGTYENQHARLDGAQLHSH
jgi:hypothetical protein